MGGPTCITASSLNGTLCWEPKTRNSRPMYLGYPFEVMNIERRRWGRSVVDEHRSVLRTAHAHAWYQGGPAEGGSGMLNLKLKRSPGGYELRAIKAMHARTDEVVMTRSMHASLLAALIVFLF